MKERLDYNSVVFKDIFIYDETVPSCLKWKTNDEAAGSRDKQGYYKVGVNNREYYCHRIVYILHNQYINNSLAVDHINGDIANNTIDNLRAVTHKTNLQNMKLRSNNSSGITGVSYSFQKKTGCSYWQAYINDVNGKRLIKSFSIDKLGYENAFELACKYRDILISEQNKLGAEYTARHGT